MPQVDVLRAAIASREPLDERERRSIDELLGWLDCLTHPFDEHADRVHLTASAIVVGGGGVLLHRHRRLGIWLQPGGHIDPGEEPWDAAQREAREETGLAVEPLGTAALVNVAFDLALLGGASGAPPIVHVDVHEGGRGHRHLDLRYLLEAFDEPPCPPPGESQEVAWFGWDEAIAMADQGLRGALVALRPC